MPDLITDPTTRTLYEDWKVRREQLLLAESGTEEYRAVEIRLLDYLLRRYQDSPLAERPALFPLAKDIFINHRAIVVHHHLGRGTIPQISNRYEAYVHVRSMLDHFRDTSEETDDDLPAKFAEPPKIDPVEAVREKLCDFDSAVRLHAALELGKIGTLDDIGLLSDLLSLPPATDEHPKERSAMLHAMQQLSGADVKPFDFDGIPPIPEDLFYTEIEPLLSPSARSLGERRIFTALLTVGLFLFLINLILFLTFLLPF